MPHYVRCVLLALEGKGREAIAECERFDPMRFHGRSRMPDLAFAKPVAMTRVFVIAERMEEARRSLLEADGILQGLQKGVLPRLELRAIHYRNALMLPATKGSKPLAALRERAQRFFDDHYAKGYACFREMATAGK